MTRGRERRRRAWARPGVVACIGLTLLWVRVARGNDAPDRPMTPSTATDAAVIPPGQEDLLAAMLGRGTALPAGCAFVNGEIERTLVRGVYDCPGGRVVIELRHPSAAPAGAAQTDKMAIVTTHGTPPPHFLKAIEGRIREREGTFEWLTPAPREDAPVQAAPNRPGCALPAASPGFLVPYVPGCYPRFAAVLLGIAQALVIVLGLACGLLRLYRTPTSNAG